MEEGKGGLEYLCRLMATQPWEDMGGNGRELKSADPSPVLFPLSYTTSVDLLLKNQLSFSF